jgi:hypothetical protein
VGQSETGGLKRIALRNLLLICATLVFASLLTPTVSAAVGDGKTLLDLCQNTGDVKHMNDAGELSNTLQCQAYIEGVLTGYSMVSKALNLKDVGIENACVPDEVTLGQLTHVVAKYLKDHSEKLHLGAGQLTMTAIKQAFPCPK